jgi:sulfur carrier protein
MVWINQKPCELQQGSTLKEAVELLAISPPFAAAVNTQFVPKTLYDQTLLNDNDKIELIVPITGG